MIKRNLKNFCEIETYKLRLHKKLKTLFSQFGENSLSVSAYSADLSSDSSQFCRRKNGLKALAGMLKQQQPKLAEQEHFEDEFWDNAHKLVS